MVLLGHRIGMSKIIELIHWLRNIFLSVENRLSTWRLLPFFLKRTNLVRWLVNWRLKLQFYIQRFVYIQRERYITIQRGVVLAGLLIRIAILPTILAGLAFAFFFEFPFAYSELASRFGWPILYFPKIDDATVGTLMGTVALTTAAILALFFTVISVVASTTYSKVATDVRSLVVNDNLNRRYLRLLAHTAAVSIAGIPIGSIHSPGTTILAGYVLALAVICILSFLPLGIRTFTLFEPASLAIYPVRQFLDSLHTVTSHGRHWLDPSFQNHARVISEQQLHLLEDLFALAITDDRSSNDTILSITATLHRLSRDYLSRKSQIPSDSLWFPKKSQFSPWQAVISPLTEIALQTGTTPSPELVPDHEFIEQRCTAITLNCIRHLLKRGAVQEDINKILLELAHTANYYARFFEQEQAMQLIASVRPIIVEWLTEKQTSTQFFMSFQVIDIFCYAALAPVLVTSSTFLEKPVPDLMGITSALLKLNYRGLYRDNHPRLILKNAEDLFRRLEFERFTEGKISTQPWWVQQIIALAYVEFLRKVVTNIVLFIEREFVNPPAELIESKNARLAGAWLLRGLEACRKAEYQIQKLDGRYDDLKSYHVTEPEWYPLEAQAALPSIAVHQKKIIQLLAEIVPNLCEAPSEPNLPDLLGQARAVIGDELIAMMELKEDRNFLELFVAYFNASTGICRELMDRARQPEKADFVRGFQDVILDLLEISGLALLFSELDATLFGKLVKATWDNYLSNATDVTALVQLYMDIIQSKTALPIFSSSAAQRDQWGQRFVQALADRGVDREPEFYYPSSGRKRPKPHVNTIIESIHVSLGHTKTDASEYFAALYLAKLEAAREVKLPYVIQECIKSIELASERQKRDNEAKDEP